MSPLIPAAIEFIRRHFSPFPGSHDAEHSLRVYENTLRIARTEPSCNAELAALAALLHDVDDHKLFSSNSNENARTFLESQGVPEEKIGAICEIINSVSFSQNDGRAPQSPEGKVVQDADRLDALGAVGIARTFAYGGEHGRTLAESVRHFEEKLLKLKDLMNTREGRRLAEHRHAVLVAFLREYEAETGRAEATLPAAGGPGPAQGSAGKI